MQAHNDNARRASSRSFAERKHSVTLRIADLRAALTAAETAAANLDAEIELAERELERERHAVA